MKGCPFAAGAHLACSLAEMDWPLLRRVLHIMTARLGPTCGPPCAAEH